MKASIKSNLENPDQLEKLYKQNKSGFTKAFNELYPEIGDSETARVWNARLNLEEEEISWGTSRELIVVASLCFLAGLVAKIPDLAGFEASSFYSRNASLIVFPFLSAWFVWKQGATRNMIFFLLTCFVASAVYINLLPEKGNSDTTILACIHLPLVFWLILGFVFVGSPVGNLTGRLNYLRFNADLLVMTAMIGIAGAMLTGITFGLFELIGININYFYTHFVLIWAFPSAPLVGTFLVRTNPQLVKNVSPVIARVFTPLVLVTLVVYLFALISSGKDPYNDREFLLIFNMMLIGVMALIFFSVAASSKKGNGVWSMILLLLLSCVAMVVNGIAFSAIIFRISEWGLTPNRLAVLGGNVLMFCHLLLVSFRIFKSLKERTGIEEVENSIAWFLPVYGAWTVFITFIVPMIFGFR